MGLPLCFLPAPNPQALRKSVDINFGWPTCLARGEEARWQRVRVWAGLKKQTRSAMGSLLKNEISLKSVRTPTPRDDVAFPTGKSNHFECILLLFSHFAQSNHLNGSPFHIQCMFCNLLPSVPLVSSCPSASRPTDTFNNPSCSARRSPSRWRLMVLVSKIHPMLCV